MWDNLGISSGFIEDEDIISKLQIVAQLEKSDPYPIKGVGGIPLMNRIEHSLRYLPIEHREPVLAVFANVIYLSRKFSHSVLMYLYHHTVQYCGCTKEEFVNNALFLEVDPTGIVNDFLRCNEIHGRLDKDKFPRTQQVHEFVLLAKREKADMLFQDDDDKEIGVNGWLKKKYWVILTDNALSGTSLVKDIQRIVNLLDNSSTKLIILARVLTEKAREKIEENFKKLIDENRMEIIPGLQLNQRFVIDSENQKCELFNLTNTFERVVQACEWLTKQDWYKEDPKIVEHKHRSREECPDDDLRFGFKRCGLTLVTSENCPSNSLPLLWYKNDKYYVPPFPRVLSRVGDFNNDFK